MLLRALIWLLLIGVAWHLLYRYLTPPSGRPGPASPPAPPPGAAPRANQASRPVETMVDCARCGVHLPRSEALFDAAGRVYCCAGHRLDGPRDAGR